MGRLPLRLESHLDIFRNWELWVGGQSVTHPWVRVNFLARGGQMSLYSLNSIQLVKKTNIPPANDDVQFLKWEHFFADVVRNGIKT